MTARCLPSCCYEGPGCVRVFHKSGSNAGMSLLSLLISPCWSSEVCWESSPRGHWLVFSVLRSVVWFYTEDFFSAVGVLCVLREAIFQGPERLKPLAGLSWAPPRKETSRHMSSLRRGLFHVASGPQALSREKWQDAGVGAGREGAFGRVSRQPP